MRIVGFHDVPGEDGAVEVRRHHVLEGLYDVFRRSGGEGLAIEHRLDEIGVLRQDPVVLPDERRHERRIEVHADFQPADAWVRRYDGNNGAEVDAAIVATYLPRQAEWEAYVSQFQGCAADASSAEKWLRMEKIFDAGGTT